MKILAKAHVIQSGLAAHVLSERAVLAALSAASRGGTAAPPPSPFVRLLAAFQDAAFIYFVLEYVPGGEFFRHLRTKGCLPEAAARFYAAEVLLALDAMHARGIVYRDLKPENLLLTAHGHVKVADMGFAKTLAPGARAYTLCGTPDYLAPEVLANVGHGRGADWWSFGVLVHEMLAGAPPFAESDAAATYARIASGSFTVPPHFSRSARDLVSRLLTVDLAARLGAGAGGTGEVKAHHFFRGVDWKAVAAHAVVPPIVPARAAADGAPVNFDDYSALPPLRPGDPLTHAEQALFDGI